MDNVGREFLDDFSYPVVVVFRISSCPVAVKLSESGELPFPYPEICDAVPDNGVRIFAAEESYSEGYILAVFRDGILQGCNPPLAVVGTVSLLVEKGIG